MSADEKNSVDNWINNQFYKKNLALLHESEGIHLIDRSPLDPITFVPEENEMQLRAQSMLNSISPGKSQYQIDPGQIIFLNADPGELINRLLAKRKTNWDKKTLQTLQDRALNIYHDFKLCEIDNIGRPLDCVVQSVAKKIFVEEYNSSNIHERLNKIANNKNWNEN